MNERVVPLWLWEIRQLGQAWRARSNCQRKRRYPDAATAQKVALQRMAEPGTPTLYWYACPVCRDWHLTKREPWTPGIDADTSPNSYPFPRLAPLATARPKFDTPSAPTAPSAEPFLTSECVMRGYAGALGPVMRAAYAVRHADQAAEESDPEAELLLDLPPAPVHLQDLASPARRPAGPDLTGRTSGQLCALRYLGKSGNGGLASQRWLCLCSCGLYTVRSARALAHPREDADCCDHCRNLNFLSARAALIQSMGAPAAALADSTAP